jgi:putative SOS response-associated peptidase YedK
MCGRFSLALAADIINGKLGVEVPNDYRPSFNIAPTQKAAVILNTEPHKIEMVKWGLVPVWAKDEKAAYSMINARADTLGERPSYKGLIKGHRCIVLADGFYEWKKAGEKKIPYRIVPTKDQLLYFAGLWTEKKRDDGSMLRTFTIITTEPNEVMTELHDRMPVILTEKEAKKWLDEPVLELLDPAPDTAIETYQVSSAINNPRNNSPELLQRIAE